MIKICLGVKGVMTDIIEQAQEIVRLYVKNVWRERQQCICQVCKSLIDDAFFQELHICRPCHQKKNFEKLSRGS